MKTTTQTDKSEKHAKAAPRSNGHASKAAIQSEVPLHPILRLQQTIGNQAVLRLMRAGKLQAKLAISQPGDVYEQEADRVADQVMRMPDPTIQRACGPCAASGGTCPRCAGEKQEPRSPPLFPPVYGGMKGGRVQGVKGIQRQSESATTDHSVSDNFIGSLGSGRPLDASTRSFFEPRFGTDFSHVRVHTDARAAESARSVNALAYTVGRDVVFGAGQYAPQTSSGKRLMAHELTHVVQQGGVGRKRIGRSNASFDLSPIGVHPLIQRDFAIEPPRPDAVGRVLTPAQMTAAIAFNNGVLGSLANSADIIEMIRDVFGGGISPLPAVVDEDFVRGVVQWQANFGLTQDGQLGPTTARPLFREIGAEGVGKGEISVAPLYAPAGPIDVPRAGARTAHFDMSAEFKSDSTNGIFPSCCEVRQEIQWDAAFVPASVAAGTGAVPHGGFPPAHPADTWIEDRDPTGTRRLGHRSGRFSEGIPGNRYLDTAGRVNQAFGHRYEGSDDPSGFATDRGSWSFRLGVYDMCTGNTLLQYTPTLVVNWL